MTVTIEFSVDEPSPVFSTWREGWKVVSFGRGDVEYDFHMSATRDGFSCCYYEARATMRPPLCGPLAVFTKYRNAISFVRMLETCYSFTSHIIKPHFRVVRCLYAPSVDRFLWMNDGFRNRRTMNGFPCGTDFADAVVLQEKVIVDVPEEEDDDDLRRRR